MLKIISKPRRIWKHVKLLYWSFFCKLFLQKTLSKKSYMFERILNTSLNNIKNKYHKIPNFQPLANSSVGLKTFQHSRSSHKTEIYTAINIYIYLCIIVSL